MNGEACGIIVVRMLGSWRMSERVCGAPAEFTLASTPDFTPRPICAQCAKKAEGAIQRGKFHAPPERGGYFERGEVVLSGGPAEGETP